jgi:quinoprotein glucose dehydrogenase
VRRKHFLAALILGCGGAAAAMLPGATMTAQDPAPDLPYAPKIAEASGEGLEALKSMRIAPGMHVDLWAAEPMLANPVCFCVDEKNCFYVVETFRLHDGVTDLREHMNWLDDELACRTVADRLAMYRKYLGNQLSGLETEHERVRLLEDRSGQGKADHATVFADGFHHADEGLAAGVLARGGNVWLACIPHLWLLRDTTGQGKATVRKALHHGYGVHVAYIGHDLHGLRFGPDGKVYFTIGDRGLHVETEGRTVSNPDSGAVLRCQPDGSELEIVATGLRNPQELAFDQYGNLFTGDNNADHGDLARWVYVVEGGDSGWRIGYQHMRKPVALGAWNLEKLWLATREGQAAYIVPPVANVADGPAGLTYEPGTSQLPSRYREHFFLCDFRGARGQSGIRSFALKPRGASFEMVDQHQCVWSVLATDVDFGMDGALYLTDWVDGWNKPNKGRIYKVHDPAQAQSAIVQEVKQLMADGMGQRPIDELVKLLGHADMRVRQEAQFALARQGRKSVAAFKNVAVSHGNQLARLHALWGLGQVGRQHPEAYGPLVDLLKDRDPEVRAQAAKLLGDGRVTAAYDGLLALLGDAEPRVRFFTAMSLGKLRRQEAVPAIVHMLRDNADQDPYVRHAGVMALTWLNDQGSVRAAARDASAAVRLAALLVLRRWQNPEVAGFLNDPDPRLVLEAARAINDVPINAALPQLAALAERSGLPDPLWYRVLNAHFRLGQAENAAALARVVARSDVGEAIRLEALQELGDWATPSGRDLIVGLWRPLAARPVAVAADALRPVLGRIFSASPEFRQEAARVVTRLGIQEIGPLLRTMAIDKHQAVRVRVETLRALETLKDAQLERATNVALADEQAQLRSEGRRILAKLAPAKALEELRKALHGGELIERQGALHVLGGLAGAGADAIISDWLDKLLSGEVAAELRLDLLEAAQRRSADAVKNKLARFEAARPKGDPLANYRETLAGGDAENGRRIFLHKAEVSCLKCHKISGQGGEVGPDLTGIGRREKREYLLESLVDPNRQIAKGFETVVVEMKNGQVHVGILKGEDAGQLRLITADGVIITIAKDQIEGRSRGKSAMPEDIIQKLSKSEVRDLVEFLANLK